MTTQLQPVRNVPEIVPVVLKQLAHMRASKAIPEDDFEKKIGRLSTEELKPRGLQLLVRELCNGNIRFIIKDSSTRSVIDLMDFA